MAEAADNQAAGVEGRPNVTFHLDRDPNDPRNKKPNEANVSDLNAEDPEKAPAKQSYQE